MDEIYNLVGKIIENAQYLEYNLIIMIKYDKILKIFKNQKVIQKDEYLKKVEEATEFANSIKRKTLGEIIYIINEMNTLSNDELKDLEKVLKTRNYLVHQYFKDLDLEQGLSNDKLLKEVRYLNNILTRMHQLNTSVASVIFYSQSIIEKIR